MKKNDFATFLVYVAMFAIALVVGIVVLRPLISNARDLPVHFVVIVIGGLVAGVLLNAGLIELGHIAGAKAGKCEVRSVCLFGLTWTIKKGEKTKVGFKGYDGLTGQTKVRPLDREESSLSAYRLLPIFFALLEVILIVIMVVVSRNLASSNPGAAWLEIFAMVILTTAAMIYFYDIFPARLDSITDGYLFVLLAKPANRVAYNDLLIAEAIAEEGGAIPETPIYDDVTEFTGKLNLLSVYRCLNESKIDEALAIINKNLNCETAPKSIKAQALCFKLALLLEHKPLEGKKMYAELEDNDKRAISNIESMAALRCYAMIASKIEGSETEANYAIDKAEKVIGSEEDFAQPHEKKLTEALVALIKSDHPSWEVYQPVWEPKKKKPEEAEEAEEVEEVEDEEEEKQE